MAGASPGRGAGGRLPGISGEGDHRAILLPEDEAAADDPANGDGALIGYRRSILRSCPANDPSSRRLASGVRPREKGMGMPPESFDVASRALTSGRSRRGAALGACRHSDRGGEREEARKREKNKKKKRRTKNKKKGKISVADVRFATASRRFSTSFAKAAKKYGQSENAMVRVARCESTLDPCAVNRSGPYYGLFQFLKSTWDTTPYGDRDIFDPEAQALAAGWMWKQGRKNEWACQ